MAQFLTTKRFKLFLLIFFLSYSISPNYINNVEAQEGGEDIPIGIGDVCSVSWNLTIDLSYYNSTDTDNMYYIRDPATTSDYYIPNHILDKYPTVKIIWFDEDIIDKKVGESFTISRSSQWSSDNLNPIDNAYGQAIIIDGIVDKLYYDSSENRTTLFDIPFFDEIIIIILIIVVLTVLYKGLTFLYSKNFFISGRRCVTCGLSSKSVGACGKCKARICRDCFEKTGKCPHCKANIYHPGSRL